MTYYCQLILDSCPDGGYAVSFPDIRGVYTDGDNKDHTLSMAKEALNLILDGSYEDNVKLPLLINRSDEGLFPIEVNPKIAKCILESKIKALQQELKNLENGVDLNSVQTSKGQIKTPSLAH